MGRTKAFLKSMNPLYAKSININYERNSLVFEDLADDMLDWAEKSLGKDYLNILIKGYIHFVNDVNRSQQQYEKRKEYKNKSYEEVYDKVYNDAQYMELYHWGVYITTFAWEHHLNLYKYFMQYFIKELDDDGELLDLGSGSGIWSLLFLRNKNNWHTNGIDISDYSVSTAQQLSKSSGYFDNSSFIVEDALTYKAADEFDAVISCFLLEHLETPEKLFSSIADNLKTGGIAFITAALTAAEIDHIFEFKKESELIDLAEAHGFRVISTLSEGPKNHPRENIYLPRSMALVLKKKANSIW